MVRRKVAVLAHYRQDREGKWRVELLRMDRGGENTSRTVLGICDSEGEAVEFGERCANAIDCGFVRGKDAPRRREEAVSGLRPIPPGTRT